MTNSMFTVVDDDASDEYTDTDSILEAIETVSAHVDTLSAALNLRLDAVSARLERLTTFCDRAAAAADKLSNHPMMSQLLK